jgi:uncharacterized protein YxeA
MKRLFLSIAAMVIAGSIIAQKYPDPEFSHEVYYLKKDSGNVLVRLEKNSSKMDTKTKMGGFGGSESGYSVEGEKSPIRFTNGKNLSFIFSTETSSASSAASAKRDSMMRANGADPSMMGMMNKDPASTITLYKTESGKGQRKILMQKIGGAFSSHKMQSSDKYTFSVKKIREGYWELVIDKTLPRGEYAFTMMDMMNMSGMGGTVIFAFAID